VASRILRNFGVVLRGRGIAAAFSVSATALMANALPVAEFGLVVLLHTYIIVVRGFLNFRTYEAIVKFGVPFHDQQNDQQLVSLLRSTMIIDVGASIASTLACIAAVPVAAYLLHWDSMTASWAAVYSLAILSTPINTANGVLRLFDRFDALSVQFTVGPVIRLVLVATAWYLKAEMVWFVLAWGVAFISGNVYLLIRGQLELHRQITVSFWNGFDIRSPLKDLHSRTKEFWHFVAVVYWQTNVDLLPKHLSTLMAGSILGPAAAGMFRLAREFSTVLTQPAVILRDVLFPDLTRSWHASDDGFGPVLVKTALIAGTVGLGFAGLSLFIGEPLLRFVGDDYAAAAPLLSLMLLAAAFDLAGASLRAAAYAMGRAASVLRIHTLGIFTYVVLFFVFALWLGLIGPGFAAICSSLLTLILTILLVGRHRIF
jgi:O-antigen/teichoic acid export membrane protein